MIDARTQAEIERRAITRACHFTPFRSVLHILEIGALLSARRMHAQHHDVFKQTDPLRLDQMLDHLSCSIEYPNVYYLDIVERRPGIYKDTAVLLIDPIVLAYRSTHFCFRNSASMVGTIPGFEGFASVFAETVQSKNVWSRTARHPLWLPTDLQAEVHVENEIPLELVRGIAVRDKTRAKRLLAQVSGAKLRLNLPLYVAPGLYSSSAVNGLRGGGARPSEEPFP
jgi:hypothetical protein